MILAELQGVDSWSFVNFYVQQETEGAHYLIDFPIGQLQSFSQNNSVGEDADYCNVEEESETISFAEFTAVLYRRALTSLKLTVTEIIMFSCRPSFFI